MLIDTRIIQHSGKIAVLAQRDEVVFRDGTSAHLHLVADAEQQRQPMVRALQLEGLHWHVFDLRHLVPQIEADLLHGHDSDHAGIVKFTLRHAFTTSGAFTAAVRDSHSLSWWRTDTAVAA